MIHDTLNSPINMWLERQSPALQEVFAWIHTMPEKPADGITELRGDSMFVNVHGYATLASDQCHWESHRYTIDVQYCISGGELIEWLPTGKLRAVGNYDHRKDTEHWITDTTPATRLRMTPGVFVLFHAGELHRPKIHDAISPGVRKLVVKIDRSLLDD